MIWLPRATILYKQSQACLNPSPRGRYRYFSIWIIWHFDSLGADTLIRHTPLPKFTGPLEDRTRSLWFSTTIAPPHPIDRNHRRPMPPWMLKEGVCDILYTGYEYITQVNHLPTLGEALLARWFLDTVTLRWILWCVYRDWSFTSTPHCMFMYRTRGIPISSVRHTTVSIRTV